MAAKIGSIYVALDVDVGRVSKFRDAANTIDRDSARIRTALGSTSRSVTQLQSHMNANFRARIFGNAIQTISKTNDELNRLRATFLALSALTGTGLTSAFAATFLLQTADRARLLSNQLKTVTTSSENLHAVQERLYRLSQDSRSSFGATTAIYARTARAAETLGISQEKLLKITETVQKAFAVGGATQEESQGAAIQLSQAIASNRFSGDEFRSVAENAPVLLRGIAQSLGVNIGKLREMGQEGLLTSEMVIKGILGASSEIEAAFDKTTSTVGQSLTQLDNAFLQYIGKADQSAGVTRRVASAIKGLAENFEEVAKYAAIAIGGGAALLGGRVASGFIGKQLTNLAERRKANQEVLDGYRKEQMALQAQGIELEKNIKRVRLDAQIKNAAAFQQGMTTKQMVAFENQRVATLKRINAMEAEGIALQKRQVAVAGELAAVQRRLSLGSRLGSSVLGFFGGPVGIAFTAAIAGMLAYGDATAKADERTYQLKKELFDLGITADLTGEKISETAKSIDELSRNEARQKLAEVRAEIEKIGEQQNVLDKVFHFDAGNLSEITSELLAIQRSPYASGEDKAASERIEQLVEDVRAGRVQAGELANIFAQIGGTNISDPMVALIERSKTALQYMAGLLVLSNQLGSAISPDTRDQFTRGRLGKQRRKTQAGIKVTEDYFAGEIGLASSSEHAQAVAAKISSLEKDLPNDGTKPTKDRLREVAEQLVNLDEKAKDAKKSTSDAAKATEKYNEELDKLRFQAETAPLSKFYQEVVQTADSLGIGTDEIEKFISAVNSGDLSAAPKKIRDIADAMRDVNAARLEADIAQTRADLFKSDIEKEISSSLREAGIDMHSSQGQLIADQMRVNDALSEGRDITQSFVATLKSNLREGMSFWQAFGDAAAKALDTIADKALAMAVNGIFDLLFPSSSGIGGGAGIAGGALGGGKKGLLGGLIIPGVLHGGGRAGSDGYSHGRQFSPALWTGAPRFHEGVAALGLRPNEVPAILERGETVLPNGAGVGGVQVNVSIIKGAKEDRVEQSRGSDGSVNIKAFIRSTVVEDLASGRLDTAMTSNFGIKRKPR